MLYLEALVILANNYVKIHLLISLASCYDSLSEKVFIWISFQNINQTLLQTFLKKQ